MPRLLTIAVALAALAVAGCGGEDEQQHAADEPRTETQSVEAGGLVYRVTMFRELNPRVAPDRNLFSGPVATGERLPFAAFIQVCNRSGAEQRAPEGFRLADAFGQAWPTRQDSVAEPFAYEAQTLAAGECTPERGSVADQAVSGAVLFFALPRKALSDRPLSLVLPPEAADGGDSPRIQLDL